VRAAILTSITAFLLPSLAVAADPIAPQAAGIVNHLHDLRADKAAQAVAELQKTHPGHPAGAFYSSLIPYQRFLLSEAKSDEALAEFEARSRAAAAAAEAWLPRAPAEANYYLGAAIGFGARADMARGRRLGAMRKGRRAIQHLEKALEYDPGFEELYLGLGMYNYFISQVPWSVRPLAAFMMGMWGDREKGLAQMERAAKRSPTARSEALWMLSLIHGSEREGSWLRAERYLAELTERHPDNPLYRLHRVYVALRLGNYDRADELASPEAPAFAETPGSLGRACRNVASYRSAESRILSGREDEAAGFLDRIDASQLPPGLVPWVRLRRAAILRKSGKIRESDELLASLPRELLRPGAVWSYRWPQSGMPEGN